MPMMPLTVPKFIFQLLRQLVNISCLGFIGYIGKNDLIISSNRNTIDQWLAIKKMINQKNHRVSVLSVRGNDFI